jgi:paraquat-inducible protein A
VLPAVRVDDPRPHTPGACQQPDRGDRRRGVDPLPAGSLPLIEIEQFGHSSRSSVLQGVTALLSAGQLVVGIIVLLCSVILPLGKLTALLVLSTGALGHRHRALTYRLVDWTGRWGMLDVLLVAILVAVLKLGDLMAVSVGPGLLAFTACVTLSLFAAASFDPHSLWDTEQ